MTLQPGPPFLRIGWWNVGLAPLAKGREVPNDEWERAQLIVQTLLVDYRLDILALGEVVPEQVGRLVSRVERSGLEICADDRGGRRPVDLAIIHDGARFSPGEPRFPESFVGGRRVARALRLSGLLDGCVRLHVHAVHWPSHLREEQDVDRRQLGTEMSREFCQLMENNVEDLLVTLGDFNDEPFAASMSDYLLGSRDRELVRARPRVRLYNPFWRWLGHVHEHSSEPHCAVAGTYYYESGARSSRWFTFDQALVSASLLDGTMWRLVEGSVRVLALPCLLDQRGRLKRGFDHLPIMCAFVRKDSGASGGDDG